MGDSNRKPIIAIHSERSLSDPINISAKRVEEIITHASRDKGVHNYDKAIESLVRVLDLIPPAESGVKKIEIRREIIDCLCKKGEYEQALETLEESWDEIRPQAEAISIEVARLHALAARIHFQLGSFAEAERECHQAITSFRNHVKEKELASTLKYLGHVLLLTGDPPGALSAFSEALEILRKRGDEVEMIGILNSMAQYYFISTDWQRATSLLEEALELAQKHEEIRLVGAASKNLGNIYYSLGKLSLAERCNMRSLRIYGSLGDTLALVKTSISLGNIYQLRREWSKAKRMYDRALSIAERKNYRRELALAHEFSGELHFDMGLLQEAEASYLTALKLARRTAHRGDMVHEICRRLAEVKVRRGQARKALALCRMSWEIAIRLGDRFEEGVIFRTFGLAYSELGDRNRAREYFLRSIETLERTGEKYERARTLLAAWRFEKAVSENDDECSAFEYYLHEARDLFKELELPYWISVIEGEMQRNRM